MFEKRLVVLETQLAFQERTIKDLSDELYEQQQEIQRLHSHCNALDKQVKSFLETSMGNSTIVNEKPPHY